jgi:hypothetical protein
VAGYPTMPKLRVDFIFYHIPVAASTPESGQAGNRAIPQQPYVMSAGVLDDETTRLQSDHFPMHFRFTD